MTRTAAERPGGPCRTYGVTLLGDLPLHLPAAPLDSPIDLAVAAARDPFDPRWEPEPGSVLTSWRDQCGCHGYVTARTTFGFRIRFHRTCEFDLSADLSQARYRISAEGNPDFVPVLIGGTVLAIRMMLAGEVVLHSSVVQIGSRGLAFVGASGQGKSTMATLMCAAGAALVTDDVGRVRFDADRVRVAVGAPESRLRPTAAALAENMAAAGVASRLTGDERVALALPSVETAEATLDAIVIPVPSRDREDLLLTRVHGVQALTVLTAFPRVLGVVDAALVARSFHGVADLVERVPLYVAQVPWGQPPDPHIPADLVKELGWC